MQSVKMNRLELLKIVKENKEKHIVEYAESVEDYKVAVLKITAGNLKLAKTADLAKSNFRAIPSRPQSYEDNYARAIRMLEFCPPAIAMARSVSDRSTASTEFRSAFFIPA